MTSTSRVPYTVIGGYLGAGKTTLLNGLLRGAGGLRIAVVVNDFGDVNIDADLVTSHDGETIALANGCICCSLVDGLSTVLQQLRSRGDAIDHVVIEASGVSDPVKIGHFAAPFGFALQGVIVVADAEQVQARAADKYVGDTVVRHLRGADLVVLNKIDLLDRAEVDRVRQWMDTVAPGTPIVETVRGELPLPVLLGGAGSASTTDAGVAETHAYGEHLRYDTVTLTSVEPLTRAEVAGFVDRLPPGVLRAKGFVHLADDGDHRHLLQVVGRRSSLTRHDLWGANPRETRLVVIGLPGSVDGCSLEQVRTHS